MMVRFVHRNNKTKKSVVRHLWKLASHTIHFARPVMNEKVD
jgi:hypothetical protein